MVVIQVIIHEHLSGDKGSSAILQDIESSVGNIVKSEPLLGIYIFSDSRESSEEHVLLLEFTIHFKVTMLLLHEETLPCKFNSLPKVLFILLVV